MTGIAMETDQSIYQEVLDELQRDSLMDEAKVRVEVDNGIVRLTGDVDSHAKRTAAEDAAHRVVGVFDVANDIKVQVPGALSHTDTELAGAVRRALDAEASVRAQHIQTSVSRGWVMLRGAVDYWLQSQDAEWAVVHVPGVLGVVNALSVRAQGWPRKRSGRR